MNKYQLIMNLIFKAFHEPAPTYTDKNLSFPVKLVFSLPEKVMCGFQNPCFFPAGSMPPQYLG